MPVLKIFQRLHFSLRTESRFQSFFWSALLTPWTWYPWLGSSYQWDSKTTESRPHTTSLCLYAFPLGLPLAHTAPPFPPASLSLGNPLGPPARGIACMSFSPHWGNKWPTAPGDLLPSPHSLCLCGIMWAICLNQWFLVVTGCWVSITCDITKAQLFVLCCSFTTFRVVPFTAPRWKPW